MLKLFAIVLTMQFIFFQPKNEVVKFGFYSNEESNDVEHSYGYRLYLWKMNSKIIGKVSFNEGAIGSDLENYISKVKYDSIDGTFSFVSQIDEDSLSFKGKIMKDFIKGDFIWPTRIEKNQILKRCCIDAPINKSYPDFNSWKKMWSGFED